MVAVGNQSAFTVERRENKVFVKPTEEGARTNLFIWTTQGRYAYELVPAGAIEQMHFAIDQEPTVVSKSLEKQAPEKTLAQKDAGEKADPLPAEMLTEATPILVYGERETRGRVEVSMRELYEKGNRLYVRYAVVNHSAQAVPALLAERFPTHRHPGSAVSDRAGRPATRREIRAISEGEALGSLRRDRRERDRAGRPRRQRSRLGGVGATEGTRRSARVAIPVCGGCKRSGGRRSRFASFREPCRR